MSSKSSVEKTAVRFTRWIGSPSSIIIHTFIFILSFLFVVVGAKLDTVLLVLTTAVSLEAIYLAIFIQMSVNRQEDSIQEVEEDIDEIQEDVDEIQEDIDEIQEDVVEISADIGEIQSDVIGDEAEDSNKTIERIHEDLKRLVQDIEKLKIQSTKS
jgi:peptidoglycan hydrolase CwlO-like protein